MTFEEAKKQLESCVREELRDPAFGDREVYWMRDNVQVAVGYFGASAREVSASDGSWSFEGHEANELLRAGTAGRVEWN